MPKNTCGTFFPIEFLDELYEIIETSSCFTCPPRRIRAFREKWSQEIQEPTQTAQNRILGDLLRPEPSLLPPELTSEMILTISNSNLDVVYHRCFFWPLVAASEDLALDLIKKQLKCLQLKPIED